MEVATTTAAASSLALHAHLLTSPPSARTVNPNRTLTSPPSTSLRASLSTNFLSPFPAIGSAPESSPDSSYDLTLSTQLLSPGPSPNEVSLPCIISHLVALYKVIPFSRGSAWEQHPPDLASYLYKNRIVYLGMSLVPSVKELILAEFLYLQYEDAEKPIYLYINSTGTIKGGEKLGYETEAFAIYDVMGYVKPPIFTLCVGNAWGEAALLLAAGATGNRSALPSSTIMPIARFQGQATDVDLARKEVKNVKTEFVKLYAKHIGKTPEQIEADIRRPKYFSPSEAVEYGIMDKVLYNERSAEDRGVVSDLKKAQLI
ncbi:hypothetical protein CRYUN_Cryun19dG0149400 [Craigia yunnanensis]